MMLGASTDINDELYTLKTETRAYNSVKSMGGRQRTSLFMNIEKKKGTEGKEKKKGR